MKKLFTIIALLFATHVSAQGPVYYPSHNYVRVIHTGTDTLLNPFTGGLMNPIFSNIDLDIDGNGIQDLFVFDRYDSKIMLFRSHGKGSTHFYHVPQYEHYFPAMDYGKLNLYAFTKDYNGDGKADIIMHSSPFVPPYNPLTLAVYKNTSAGNLNFELEAPEIYYETKSDTEALALPNDGIPNISDIDFDGDMDILYFPGGSTKLRYLRNMSVELNKPKDTLIYWYVEECWGHFAEDGSSVQLGFTDCSSPDTKSYKSKHAGSAVVALDADGDGDSDILLSEAAKSTFKYLENGRIQNGSVAAASDTIIGVTDEWPFSKKAFLNYMPYASIVDVDNDGRNDVIISPLDGYASANMDFIWYYRDEARFTDVPDLKFKADDFLVNSMIDWGNYSIPIFLDYNLDGLTDMIVSVLWKNSTGYESRRQVYYKNIGTKTKPVYKLENSNLAGIMNTVDADNLQAVATTDFNNDGTVDLMVGLLTGEIIFYQGSKGASNLKFQAIGPLQVMDNSQLADLIPGPNASPAFADLSGDGKQDLIVGHSGLKLSYYKNISSSSTPVFELVTNSYGDISVSGFGAPTLSDLDNNGIPELILGASDGSVRIYPDASEQPTMGWAPYSNLFYDFGTSQAGSKDFGSNTFIATAQLDQDSTPDLMIGNARGGIYFMGSANNGIGTHPIVGIEEPKSNSNTAAFNLYPNPVQDRLTINFKGSQKPEKYNIIISDISGRQLSQTTTELADGVSVNMDTKSLSNGIYFLTLQSSSNGLTQTQKFIKN